MHSRHHLSRRTTSIAALVAVLSITALGEPPSVQANVGATSCKNHEADCQSMANAIARRTSKATVKSIVCSTTNTATVTLDNGRYVETGWLGGFATAAVFDSFSGLHMKNSAFKYSCSRSGIEWRKVF